MTLKQRDLVICLRSDSKLWSELQVSFSHRVHAPLTLGFFLSEHLTVKWDVRQWKGSGVFWGDTVHFGWPDKWRHPFRYSKLIINNSNLYPPYYSKGVQRCTVKHPDSWNCFMWNFTIYRVLSCTLCLLIFFLKKLIN